MSNHKIDEASQTDEQEHEVIMRCIRKSERVPGWTRGEEAAAIVRASLSAPHDAVIVEVGSFLGCGTILLAAARQFLGSGRVHSVDAFDGSGDAVSVPHYQAILLAFWGRSPRQHFEDNLQMAGVSAWVDIHEGRADQIAAQWTTPIDLLVLDADQSPEGARLIYESWSPWLKPDALIALHNSNEREYESGHEGNRLLVVQELIAPSYHDIRCVGSTTFARRSAGQRG